MIQKQRGTSYLGIFFAIVLFAFAAKLTISLWPAYWDDRLLNQEIESALTSLQRNATPDSFKADLSKKLEINNIRDLNVDEIVTITYNSNGMSVHKHYQVNKHFISNIELLVTFDKTFDKNSSIVSGQ